MKILRLIAAAFIAFAPAVAFAQPSPPLATNTQAKAGWDAAAPMTAQVVVPPPASGGVINIGQAFGPIAQPYIDAAVQGLIAAGVSWLGYLLHKYLGIQADKGQRDALTSYLQNAASSLIADGAVSMQGKTVTVSSSAIAAEANSAINRIPDALKHFGLDTPGALETIKQKIIDAIPQVPAGAQMVAQTSGPATPAKPAVPAVEAGDNAAPVKPPLEVQRPAST